MTEEELDKQIRQLQAEKTKIERVKEESEFGEHAKTILTKGSLKEDKLFDVLFDGHLPKILYCDLHWKDAKYRKDFVYEDIEYVYNWTEDDGRIVNYCLKKINGERFTLEDLVNLIPKFEETLDEKIEQMERHAETLKELTFNYHINNIE